jgi:hypothetical protein
LRQENPQMGLLTKQKRKSCEKKYGSDSRLMPPGIVYPNGSGLCRRTQNNSQNHKKLVQV